MKKKNIPFLLSFLLFITGVLCLILYLFRIKAEDEAFANIRGARKASEEKTEEKKDEDEGLNYYLISGEPVQEGLKDVYLKNRDVIGWIKIDGTPIDYPIMYTPDDIEYYIHRGFDKEYSFGGCIFAGEGTSIDRPSDNIITYGHHMIDKSMYHEIDRYEDEEYYKAHKYLTFDTLRQTGKYEVIASFRTQIYPEDYDGFVYWKFVNAKDENEFNDFIEGCKSLSSVGIPTTAEYGDQLLTLSTCAYHTHNGRFVVVAKRVEGDEIDLEKEPKGVIE